MTIYAITPSTPIPVVKPGDTLNFLRGVSFPKVVINGNGTASAPVSIGAYGTGALPKIKGLEIYAPYTRVWDINGSGADWAGIVLGAPFGAVRRSLFDGSVTGVHLKSDDCLVDGVKCRANTKMSVNTPTPTYDDSGAFGIAVNGNRNTIYRAQIDGHIADSYDFGKDGSAIELYDANDTIIADIISYNNETFCELGGKTARTDISDTTVISSLAGSKGLVTRGAQDQFGPVLKTKLSRVGMYLTGAGSSGVVSYGGTTVDTLELRDNIIVAHEALWTDGPIVESGNIYVGSVTRG